jgi:hypothetical protein
MYPTRMETKLVYKGAYKGVVDTIRKIDEGLYLGEFRYHGAFLAWFWLMNVNYTDQKRQER